jgi:hypothetical protein
MFGTAPYPGAVRPPTIAIGDLYPEAKGPRPSTAQLGNPHEVAAAAGAGAGLRLATVPSLNPAELLGQPATWAILLVVALLALGMRR